METLAVWQKKMGLEPQSVFSDLDNVLYLLAKLLVHPEMHF